MDIVERLRKLVILDEVGSDNPLGRDAADEIERLRGELNEAHRQLDYWQKMAFPPPVTRATFPDSEKACFGSNPLIAAQAPKR